MKLLWWRQMQWWDQRQHVVVGVDVHTGTGPKIIRVLGVEQGMEVEAEAAVAGCGETSTVAAGASTKTATSAVGRKQAHVQLLMSMWWGRI